MVRLDLISFMEYVLSDTWAVEGLPLRAYWAWVLVLTQVGGKTSGSLIICVKKKWVLVLIAQKSPDNVGRPLERSQQIYGREQITVHVPAWVLTQTVRNPPRMSVSCDTQIHGELTDIPSAGGARDLAAVTYSRGGESPRLLPHSLDFASCYLASRVLLMRGSWGR